MALIDEKVDPNVCILYEKTGCCPKGDLCNKKHLLINLPRCVVFHHIFPNPDFFIDSLPPGKLKISQEEKQRLIDAFFLDLFLMVKNFGIVDDIVLAANRSDHLSGNAWVWFRETDAAFMCQSALSGQYYAGRKIFVSLCSSPRLSLSLCKNHMTGECPSGASCYLIHPLEPSFHIFNECIPRSLKVYPERFRKWKIPKILDSPNDIVAGTCKTLPSKDVKIPRGFPQTNIYAPH